MITRELCLVIFTYRVYRGSDHDLDANKELIRLNFRQREHEPDIALHPY